MKFESLSIKRLLFFLSPVFLILLFQNLIPNNSARYSGPIESTPCIYAGWFQKRNASSCPPVQEAVLKGNDKTDHFFSCLGNNATKETIICQPILFGLNPDESPICIEPSEHSTKDCSEKVKNTAAIETFKVANRFTTEYQSILQKVKLYCAVNSQSITNECREIHQRIQFLNQESPTKTYKKSLKKHTHT